jgi:hypothetical protein
MGRASFPSICELFDRHDFDDRIRFASPRLHAVDFGEKNRMPSETAIGNEVK